MEVCVCVCVWVGWCFMLFTHSPPPESRPITDAKASLCIGFDLVCVQLFLWPWQRRRQVRGWKAAFHAPPDTWCILPGLAAHRYAAPSPCWRGLVQKHQWWWHSVAWAGGEEFKKCFIYIQLWLVFHQYSHPLRMRVLVSNQAQSCNCCLQI